jgi:hypothetical protein
MAAADSTAIEHVLDREVDVDSLRLAGNFDAVAKGRHGAVRPARSTVLRDVLVPAHGAVVDTIFIAPGERCGQIFGLQVVLHTQQGSTQGHEKLTKSFPTWGFSD